MKKVEQICENLKESNGIIKTSDIINRGSSKAGLAKFVRKYNYNRVSKGIYCSSDIWRDELYLLQLRCPKIIFSHETALFLHGMTDQEPLQYTITVKSGYNATHLRKSGSKVFSIKKEFFELGETKVDTPFGNEVSVYNQERTICDMIRSRSKIEVQIFQEAIKNYVKSRDKNLHLLMEYAETFRVKRILNNYLEVLL